MSSKNMLLADAEKNLAIPGKARVELIRTTLLEATKEPGFSGENSNAIISLISKTISLHSDAYARRVVDNLFKACIGDEGFLKMFAGFLVKQKPGIHGVRDSRLYLKWAVSIVERLEQPEFKKPVQKLLEVCAKCFDNLLMSGKLDKNVSKKFKRLLKKRPELVADCMIIVTETESNGMVKVILEYGLSDTALMEEVKKRTLKIYTEKIICSKIFVGQDVLEAYKVLVQNLSQKEFSEDILPVLIRSCKRNIESALETASVLITDCSLDMSSSAMEILETILPFIRHSKEEIYNLADSVLQVLVKQVSNGDILKKLLDTVCEILEGKREGKIKSIHERNRLATAIGILATSPSVKNSKFFQDITNFCIQYYNAEAIEDTKLKIIEVLCLWLEKGSSIPKQVLEFILQALGSKESIRKAALSGLLTVLQNETLRTKAADLTPPLCKIINNCISKVAQRSELLQSLLAALWISAADMGAEGILGDNEIWKIIVSTDCVVYDFEAVIKLSVEDCRTLARIMQSLLISHGARLEEKEGVEEKVTQVLLLLMMHPSKAVRKTAFGEVSRILGLRTTLAFQFLSALRYWQKQGRAALIFQSNDDVCLASALYVSDIFGEILSHLGKFCIDGDFKMLSCLLLQSHHPTIAKNKKSCSCAWARIKEHQENIKDLIESASDEICSIISGDQGLASEDINEVKAALGAIFSAVGYNSPKIYDALFRLISSYLKKEELENLSENDLFIFNTPEGVLSCEWQKPVIYLTPEEEKKQRKKDKLRREKKSKHERVAFGGISDSDSDDNESVALPAAQQVRASVAAAAPPNKNLAKPKGKGHMDAAEREAIYKNKILLQESQVRASVASVRIKFKNGLAAIGALVKGSPRLTAKYLENLCDKIFPILTHPLTEESAFDTLCLLCQTLPMVLSKMSLDVATLIRITMLYESGKKYTQNEVMSHDLMKSVVNAIVTANEHKPLSDGAYYLCLPIIKTVLTAPMSSLHEPVVKVLAKYIVEGSGNFKRENYLLMYEVLEHIPAFIDWLEPAIMNLASKLHENEIPYALTGLLNPKANVRGLTLKSLKSVPAIATGQCPDNEKVISLLMIGMSDVDENNKELGEDVWDISGCVIPPTFVTGLFPYLRHSQEDIRLAAADALEEGLQIHQTATQDLIDNIVTTINSQASRFQIFGCALALQKASNFFDNDQIVLALQLLLENGFTHPDDEIRAKMVEAGVALVDKHSVNDIGVLYDILQSKLTKKKSASKEQEIINDRLREGSIIVLGTMAKHLLPQDPKVRLIIDDLIGVLSTPSESVQLATSKCLAPLIQMSQSDRAYIESIIETLHQKLINGRNYGERRGAAFGIAGFVKSLGISSLKNYKIMDKLKVDIEDKSSTAREGSIMAFECLCDRLGKLFEPYIIHILPILLTSFGDPQLSVRHATMDASRAIMRNLSAQGVKLVLPSLLKGLTDPSWRTKQGSVQLLGAMAWCAPKQLSACMSTVIPKIGEVLLDPHPKVQESAREALKEVGNTIRNPEIQNLVPYLINAIAHPGKHMKECMDILLETVFVNTIDASSLALIMPVVHKGLKDRGGSTKRKASIIVQSLCKLVNDPKDMIPYSGTLIPELKDCVVDMLPDVRAQASKALGVLLFDLGKESMEEIMPWLLKTLENKDIAERSGAAQALAEILAKYSSDYLDKMLPEIFASCKSTDPYARQGSITVFKFMPFSMPDIFIGYLTDVLPYIIDGLADENEAVREASLAAGRALVEVYAESSLKIILPAVEVGLSNENWRIRESSVELLGNLFFKVAGTSGKIKVDGGSDDEGVATISYDRNIIKALGVPKRNDILARLYFCRSDVQISVRHEALHIWKTVVTNTPKTLGEILPALMDLIIETLAQGGEDVRLSSGRCLGDLVKKMGEKVLPRIIPILKEGTLSQDALKREGVCYGLQELLDNLSRVQLTEYLPVLLPTIQFVLCDSDTNVREAAANAFSALFKSGASTVVDTVVPDFLTKLEVQKEQDQALEGLRVILSVRPQTLSIMVPRLFKAPIKSFKLKALGSLAEVASVSLPAHLQNMVPQLLSFANDKENSDLSSAASESLEKVAGATPEESVDLLLSAVLKGLDDATRKYASAEYVSVICKTGKISSSENISSLLQALVPLLIEDSEAFLKEIWTALSSVTKLISTETLPNYVRVLKDSVQTAKEKIRRRQKDKLIPGLCSPEGLKPLLPIYVQGFIKGSSAEIREMALEGLSEMIQLTNLTAITPFIKDTAGPMIKIMGERFPWQIKYAMLCTLGDLLEKAPDPMKLFAIPLQTSFLKCFKDPSAEVRAQAALNLGKLSRMSARVDNLTMELSSSAVKAEDSTRNDYLTALAGTFISSGHIIKPETLSKTGFAIFDLVSDIGDSGEDVIPLAKCMGAFCKSCIVEELKTALTKVLGPVAQAKWTQRYLQAIFVATISLHCFDRIEKLELTNQMITKVTQFSRDDRIPIKIAATRCVARIISYEIKTKEGTSNLLPQLLPVLISAIGTDQNSDVQNEGLKALRQIYESEKLVLFPFFSEIIPSICALFNASQAFTKSGCEETLAKLFDISETFEKAREFTSISSSPVVKILLTDSFLRRLQQLQMIDIDKDSKQYEEY